MTDITALYSSGKLVLSFELFPPKSEAGMAALFESLRELVSCEPSFITCTYGAGGSTRAKTLEVLERVLAEYPQIPVASHLTCVGSTVQELREYIGNAIAQGVSYLVALRGDPPRGETVFTAVEGGLRYGSELVALVNKEFPELGIVVGGYPEKHPEAADLAADIDNLKRKVDAGADVIVTQLFYDNEDFFRWRDQCVRGGISIPIVPGVLPMTNLAQIQRFCAMCGACVPEDLARRMAVYPDGSEGQFAVGAYHATRQVEGLVEAGVPGVHFYVLNKARATAQVCRALTLSQLAVHPPASEAAV